MIDGNQPGQPNPKQTEDPSASNTWPGTLRDQVIRNQSINAPFPALLSNLEEYLMQIPENRKLLNSF
jgi:hypothetical protein